MTQHRSPQRRRRRSRLTDASTALVVASGEAVALGVVAATFAAILLGHDVPITTVEGVIGTLTFVTVGGFLVVKAHGNVVGWLLWTAGLLLAVTFGAGYLASEGLTVSPGSIYDAIWLAWLSNWMGAPGLLLAGGILPLYFPTGRPLAGRWRVAGAIGLLDIVVATLASVFGHFTAGTYPPGVDNPIAIGGIGGDLLAVAHDLAFLVFAVMVFPVAAASLIVRYKRSTELERRQLRPFGALAGFVVAALITAFLGGGLPAWFAAVGGLALLPLTIGYAVLRHRLYDIDRLISRTIAYGLLTATVGGLFVVLVLVLSAVLAPLTRTNELAVAGSTLLVFFAFQPLRNRIQRVVNRRFNRTRYDADRSAAEFTDRLRDEVDLETLAAEVIAIVGRTVEPRSVSLWVHEHDRP